MNISLKFWLIIFVIGFLVGTSVAGHYLADHPQHLLAYVWPTLEARLLITNSFTANGHIYLHGQTIAAYDLINAWYAQNPDGYMQLMRAFKWSPLVGMMTGLGLLWLIAYLDLDAKPMRHLRGRYLARTKAVSAAAKRLYGAGLILLGSVRWPEWQENEGLLLPGATGSGKTTAILSVLDVAAQRSDKAVIVAQNGALMAHYMPSNNVLLLNPFDARTLNWSSLAEMRAIYDAPRLAKSAIPDAQGYEAQQWTMYAQQMLAAVLERLFVQRHATNANLLEYFRPEGQANLRALLAGKAVSAVFMPGNERLAANVQGVLSMYLSAHEYLDPQAGAGSFSITEWVRGDKSSWLWITYLDSQLDALKPLIGTWLDLASSATTSLPAVKRNSPAWQFWKERVEPRRIWNIVDEAKSVGKIQSLEDSITKGRKAGLRTVIGIQSISQLRELYGNDRATTILGSLKSAVVFNTEDPDTGEYLSKRIGDGEVEITNTNSGRGAGELTNSHTGQSTQRTVRRVVLPSEIAALPNLSAYVVLSGVSAVARVKFEPRELLERISSFIPKPNPPVPPAPFVTSAPIVAAPAAANGPEFV